MRAISLHIESPSYVINSKLYLRTTYPYKHCLKFRIESNSDDPDETPQPTAYTDIFRIFTALISSNFNMNKMLDITQNPQNCWVSSAYAIYCEF